MYLRGTVTCTERVLLKHYVPKGALFCTEQVIYQSGTLMYLREQLPKRSVRVTTTLPISLIGSDSEISASEKHAVSAHREW